MGKIIIPDKLNVAFQERRAGWNYYDNDAYEKFLLGFTTYYKKDETLNVETHKTWGSKDIPLQDHDNVALEGFEVAGSVGRYTGNKVVEINDPRGFRLQIAVANLMILLDNCVMDHGKFVGKMAWGWDGGKLCLYSEDSDLYLEGRANFKYDGSPNIAPKTIGLGSTVILSNGKNAVYYGAWYFGDRSPSLLGDGGHLSAEQQKGHLFWDTRTKKYFDLKSPTFKAVVEKKEWTRGHTHSLLKPWLIANSSYRIAELMRSRKLSDINKSLGLDGKNGDDHRGRHWGEWAPGSSGLGDWEQREVQRVIQEVMYSDFGGGTPEKGMSWYYYGNNPFQDTQDNNDYRKARSEHFSYTMAFDKEPTGQDWLKWVLENVREVYRGDLALDGSSKRFVNPASWDRHYAELIAPKMAQMKEHMETRRQQRRW